MSGVIYARQQPSQFPTVEKLGGYDPRIPLQTHESG